MSDTVVVMNEGTIQQIGTPIDIYNEPENRFVAGFIGESNIIEGVMIKDFLVAFDDFEFICVDKGFPENEPVDVVIRPEDIDIVQPDKANLKGIVKSVTFKGVHYETIVTTNIPRLQNRHNGLFCCRTGSGTDIYAGRHSCYVADGELLDEAF